MGLLGDAVGLWSDQGDMGIGRVRFGPALRRSPEGARVGTAVGAQPLPQLQLGLAGKRRSASQGPSWAAAPLEAPLLG